MRMSSHCIYVRMYICWSLCVVLMAAAPPELMSVVLMSLDDGTFGLSLQYDVKVLTYTYTYIYYILYTIHTYTYILI